MRNNWPLCGIGVALYITVSLIVGFTYHNVSVWVAFLLALVTAIGVKAAYQLGQRDNARRTTLHVLNEATRRGDA